MNISSQEKIGEQVSALHRYFNEGTHREYRQRIAHLKELQKAIRENEQSILNALWKDLHKSAEEAYLTEISIVLQEIETHISHLRRWMCPKEVCSPISIFPSRSEIDHEPLGVALIIAPWNYPFQLLINPFVGALSAGCCALLKPSPYTPAIAEVMEEIITRHFPPGLVSVAQGGREVNQWLLQERFDMIFFTGSPSLGRKVMHAAAEQLIPCVLELGGKSPVIVDREAHIPLAAKRIIWGKTINAGQTCIAPDYLWVHSSVKEPLIEAMKREIEQTFGTDPEQNPYYPRIVNEAAFDRLSSLMLHGRIRAGGVAHRSQRYISPTLIDEVTPQHPIMNEEIFGPLLPIMTFEQIDEAIAFINSREKPLALYYFGPDDKANRVLRSTTSGGGCINDTLLHIVNHRMPFGGVGHSGIGKYHGHDSFLSFSNRRSIVRSTTRIDLPFRYIPFPFFKWIKKIL